MSELFEGYEQDFLRSMKVTRSKLDRVSEHPADKQNAVYRDIKGQLSQAERSLKYLEAEYSSLPANARPRFQKKVIPEISKVTERKKEYAQLRKRIQRQQEDAANERNKTDLFGSFESSTADGNQKLIAQGQELSDCTYKLKNSLKLMQQNQAMSDGAQLQLARQTKMLEKNKQGLNTINEDLTQSQMLVRKIGSLMRRNKLLVGGVLCSIVVVVLIVLIITIKGKLSQ